MPNNKFNPLFYYFICHLRALLFGLGELVRTPLSSLITVIVIGIAVALPSGFYLLLQNFQHISNNWSGSPRVSVYIDANLSNNTIKGLENKIIHIHGVKNTRYISPQQGLKEFEQLTQLSNALSGVKHNPLPGVIVVTPESNFETPGQIKLIASELKSLPHIQLVQLDLAWLQRLFNIVTIIKRVIFTLGVLFALGVVLITGNTIRLIMQNHAREMAIMRLLGATYAFIRRPFLYRGFWLGFVGGIIAWILVSIMLWWLENPILDLISSYGSHAQLHGLGFSTGLLIIIMSCVLSMIGAYVAVRHHLNLDETV